MLYKLKNRDFELGEWLKALLCANGWEPFAVNVIPTEASYRDARTVYYFRLEISA